MPFNPPSEIISSMDGSSAGAGGTSSTVEEHVIEELDLTELNEFSIEQAEPKHSQHATSQPAIDHTHEVSQAQATDHVGLQTPQHHRTAESTTPDPSAEVLSQIIELPAMVQKLHEGYMAAVGSLAVRVNQLEAKLDRIAATQDRQRERDRNTGPNISQGAKGVDDGVIERAGYGEQVPPGDKEARYRTPRANRARPSLTPPPVFQFPRFSRPGADGDEQSQDGSPAAESERASGKRKRAGREEEAGWKRIRRWPLPPRRGQGQESGKD